jgi:MFS family permease
VLVGTLALTELISWGVLYYTFPVMLVPMQQELGWSRVELTAGFSLALGIAGLLAIPVRRWVDRHGPRLLITVGSGLAALLVAAWALVPSHPAFLLIWRGIGVVMATVLYEPAFAVVATWFRRGRGRALTLLTCGGGLASVIFVPLTTALVEQVGWRAALLGLRAILAVGPLPLHALLLRRRPRDLGLLPDGIPLNLVPVAAPEPEERSVSTRDAVRGAVFWWLTGAFALGTFASIAAVVHLIPYLLEQGYSAGFAATATSLVGLMALPGRVLFTPRVSRLPRRWVTAGLFLLQAAAVAVLLAVPGPGGVLGCVVLFGVGAGALTPARAALVAAQYGPAYYGRISGVLTLGLTGARAVVPVGTGLLYSETAHYTPVFGLLLLASLLAAGAVLRVRDHAAQVG